MAANPKDGARRNASPQMPCAAIPDWPAASARERHVLGVLAGEGIGGEIVAATLDVLRAVCARFDLQVDIRIGGAIGKEAQKQSGKSLTDEVVAFCDDVFRVGGAVLCGPGGGRFVYDLRARFDLYCKFTPLRPVAALADAGVLRPDHLAGIDIVAVRENVGGFYFGEWGLDENGDGAASAFHRVSYHAEEVDRVLLVGYALARMRRRKLCVTVKPGGVPTISRLWEERLRRIAADSAVDVSLPEIDNAAYQLIAHPAKFDVVVSPNMFGDILADCGALLLGSRGMSHSGNFGPGGRAVYQTGHGAAHDIAGTDTANPVGQIRSLAMLLSESFGWVNAGAAIEAAIDATLARGWRTPDIAARGGNVVGTRELSGKIATVIADSSNASPVAA